jgi:hypothetical protein
MTEGALFWFVIFCVSAGLFFGIALVVTFRGTGDLRHLLKTAQRKEPDE